MGFFDSLGFKKDKGESFYKSKHALAIIHKNKIIDLNDSFANLLNYSINDIKNQSFSFSFVDNEQSSLQLYKNSINDVIKSEEFCAEDNFLFESKDGDRLWLRTYITSINYEDKEAALVYFTNITRNREILKGASSFNKDLKHILNISNFAIGHRYSDGKYEWSPQMFEILDLPEDTDVNKNLFLDYILEEDKQEYLDKINSLNENNTHLDMILKIRSAKGNLKHLSFHLIREFEGIKCVKGIVFIEDISELMNFKQKLETSYEDRLILLQEVYHRVKNNLQIILSLLNLERRFNRDKPAEIVDQTNIRIRAMASMYEKIYQSNNFSSVDMKDYIPSAITSLCELYSAYDISINLNLETVEVNMDVAIPLALVINEVVTNSIRYAFPNGKGNIDVILKNHNHVNVTLIIKDDGIGLDKSIDVENPDSLGLIIIKSLSDQINADFKEVKCEGLGFEFNFPVEIE